MPNLTIYIKNYSSLKPTIFIDDKEIKIQKKNGKSFCSVSCNTLTKLKIKNYHPLNQRFGFIFCYFFFLISLLGIFDIRYRNKEKTLLFSAELYLKEDSVLDLHYNTFSKDQEAVELTGDCAFRILENQYTLDQELKRKIRLMKILKIVSWICFIIILAVLIYNFFN
ncbi:MAG: hypothetical protein K2I88_03805 [Anaeroplasmataceae bacterium]|nr:hypothetical protein [Anaeroplasmataceae bacterium]